MPSICWFVCSVYLLFKKTHYNLWHWTTLIFRTWLFIVYLFYERIIKYLDNSHIIFIIHISMLWMKNIICALSQNASVIRVPYGTQQSEEVLDKTSHSLLKYRVVNINFISNASFIQVFWKLLWIDSDI